MSRGGPTRSRAIDRPFKEQIPNYSRAANPNPNPRAAASVLVETSYPRNKAVAASTTVQQIALVSGSQRQPAEASTPRQGPRQMKKSPCPQHDIKILTKMLWLSTS